MYSFTIVFDYTLNMTAALLEEPKFMAENSSEFPFVNDDTTIANLVQELPLYLVACDGVTVTCEDNKTER